MAEQSEQLVLSLPYEDVTGLMAGQSHAKTNYSRGNDILVFKIPFKDILIWEGYNARTVYENIPELADSLLKHKQKVPFQLILLKDGRAYLKKGGRRHKAYQYLIEQKLFDPETEVPFELTSTRETMEEMILDLFTSNNLQEKLKPIDQATVAWRLKHLCGKEKSNEEVAALMTVSRQTVDNLIIIYEAPDDIKNEIRNGDMSFTDAISFIRRQRKDKKESDKKEEKSHQSSMGATPLPKDELKDELEELKALDEQAEEYNSEEARQNRERIALERLYEVANEVLCNREDLTRQLGKHLAKDATITITEQILADDDSGELLPTEITKVIVSQETELEEIVIDMLIEAKVGSVFIYKQHSIAKSVITEPPAEKEKGIYDEQRPEIAQIQNIIKLSDRMAVRVEKLDIPEGDKKDILDWIKWQQNDMWPLRDWIHSNKKQNKAR